MDTNQLLYFIEVCNTGNISKAAQALHLSQQGLSASIRRLEHELGCDLFYRKASGIVLTDIGKIVLSEAKAIANHVERIQECCSNKTAGKYTIKIAVTESLIVRFPTELQRLLINGTDEFDVQLIEKYSVECCNLVDEAKCTFGIIYGNPDEKRFDIVSLDTVKQVIIVNKNHPLAGRDTIPIAALDNIPFALPHKGTYPYNNIANIFKQNNIRLNVSYECDRPRQTIDIVSNNPFLVSRTIADEITVQDLQKIKVLELEDEPFVMPVKLISQKGHELNMFERIFKRLILDYYK